MRYLDEVDESPTSRGEPRIPTSIRGSLPGNPPMHFGHYRVTATIGTGFTTVVHRAETEGIGRPVVLKVLRSTAGRESAFFRGFEREARLLASLRHPNIVELFDYDGGATGERPPFMALEHIDGATLRDVLTRTPRVEPEEAAAIALEVARGLTHAHARGVVHRDIKPANILLGRTSTAEATNGDRIVVKVADFGVAHEKGGNETEGSEALGTPAYMSPEQLLGDAIDHRSDQFALGIVLYQLIAGSRPFDGDDGRPAIQRIRRDPPRPLRTGSAPVPRALERIVLRLLAKRPADRFEKTDEVVAELARFLETRVDTLDDLSPLHRRVLSRAGVIDERRGIREEPADSRGPTIRKGPVRIRAVPLTPTLVGIALAALGMIGGGGYIQWKLGGIREREAPKPLAAASADGTETAKIRLLVRPWAEVVLDGKKVDVTPLAKPLSVRPGRHVIVLQHPLVTERRVVEIGNGQQVTLDVTLNVPQVATADEFLPPPTAPSGSVSAAPKPVPSTVPSSLVQP